jgi:hypothetical protein
VIGGAISSYYGDMALEDCFLIRDATSHRASSYDRTGGNLDFITDLAPGEAALLLDTPGPGKITHLWMTLAESPVHDTVLRDLVLRIYWEGVPVPGVEVPLGDFFGLGHALPGPFYQRRKFEVVSAPVAVGQNEKALNCYWPMPFQRAARVEIYNNGPVTLRLLYYHVDYELGPQPENAGLFHAVFRQSKDHAGQMDDEAYTNLDGRDNYVLLETKGRGQYVGCFFYIDANLGCWWGEGDDMIFIDYSPLPAIYGTGSEDYFNNAWGYGEPFSYPYYGAPLLAKHDKGEYTTLYRFHLPDPVHFKAHLRVTMECWWLRTQAANLASVAFWYQEKPVVAREALPGGRANHPHFHPLPPEDRFRHGDGGPAPGQTRVGAYSLEEPLRAAGARLRMVTVVNGQVLQIFGGSGLVLETEGREWAMAVPAPEDGRFRVEVKPIYSLLEEPMMMRIEGGEATAVQPQSLLKEDEGPFLDLGEAVARDGKFLLHVSAPRVATIQAILLTKL